MNSKKASFDKQTLKFIDKIEELEPSVKDNLIFLAIAIIKDTIDRRGLLHINIV